MRPRHEYDEVARLVQAGCNDSQIARHTGISRWTVRHCRLSGPPGVSGSGPHSDCPRCDHAPLDRPRYAYLLGLYLGDGSISKHPRAHRLRIVLDERYPGTIDETGRAIAAMRPRKSAKVGLVRKVGCVEVSAYWQHWPCLFPQHGKGPKHLREIALAPWQQTIVRAHPKPLLRGLIHSDGCRTINRVWKGKHAYPRYFFTNSSGGILRIFRDACDIEGIRHRDSRPNTISVARRQDVAALDAFVGPKA